MKELWIVGKWFEDVEQERRWEFQGIFSSEEKAVSACIFPTYFVAPAILDERVSDSREDWKGAYYPEKLKTDNNEQNKLHQQLHPG